MAIMIWFTQGDDSLDRALLRLDWHYKKNCCSYEIVDLLLQVSSGEMALKRRTAEKLEEAFAEFVSATSYIYIQLSCDA